MKQKSQLDRSLLQKWTALFFVLVIACFGFVQVVHMHNALTEQPGPATSHCLLCVVAHNAVVFTEASSAPVPTLHSEIMQLSEPQHESRLLIPSCLVRPPPPSL